MSLLMQALKKAERAKQNSVPETELEKPSEAFDDLLALTPQESTPPASAGGEFMLDLEPLDGPATSATPAPAASAPPPAALDASLAPLSFETEPPIPALSVADEAIHDPVPPQARHQEQPRPTPPPAAQAAAQAAQASQDDSRARAAAKPEAPRGAARARAAAASAMNKEAAGLDPAKIRLAVLSGIAVLIAAVFGYIYWQATTAPGPGARLPMVPMPPPGATGTAPAQLVVASPSATAGAPDAANPAAGAAPAGPGATPAAPVAAPPAPAQALSPAEAAAMAAREESERRQQQREMLIAQQERGGAFPAPGLGSGPGPGPGSGPGSAPGQPAPGLSGPDALAPLAAPDSTDIKVARSNVPQQADPALQAGYLAFNGGDLARAQQQYELALRTDPNNRDALLGTAAVALRQRQEPRAAAIYSRLLDLDPNDGDALAGMMGLRQGDAAQAELRLKTVLTRTPDAAPVQFALGNLYARQGRWSEAQQAYFRAWSAAPGNADYAYNLAIGLDRLNQGRLALTYYQKALALAQDSPAGFDRAALRQRMHQLNQHGQQ